MGRLVRSGQAALALFAALWQTGHEAYGDFILPAPLVTISAAINILSSPENWAIFIATMRRALIGFTLSACIGGFTGLIASYSPATMRLARALLTVILGVPPIAGLLHAGLTLPVGCEVKVAIFFRLISVFLRILSELAEISAIASHVSASIFWAAGFGLWLWRYYPKFDRPRHA